jgi:hypothetical protein
MMRIMASFVAGIIRNSPNTLNPAQQAGKASNTFDLVRVAVAIAIEGAQSAPFLYSANLCASASCVDCN